MFSDLEAPSQKSRHTRPTVSETPSRPARVLFPNPARVIHGKAQTPLTPTRKRQAHDAIYRESFKRICPGNSSPTVAVSIALLDISNSPEMAAIVLY